MLVDEQADDDQFEALKAIFSGEAGGAFGDIAPLIGNFLGAERARISFETSDNGESGSASVDGSEFSYAPLKGPHGDRTELDEAPNPFTQFLAEGAGERRYNSNG